MRHHHVTSSIPVGFVIGIILLGFLQTLAWSHEVIIKPERFRASAGQPLPIQIISTEVFMTGDEIEPVDRIEAAYHQGDSRLPIALTPNAETSSLEGAITPEKAGMAVLAAHRKGMIWTKTRDGWKQGPKSQYPDALQSGQYEKFAKTLLTIDSGASMHTHRVGHRLELVPVNDPTTLGVGREAVFRVLFDGEPIAAQVFATYDGFSKHKDTFAYATQATDNGIAHVKLTHAGNWMVRVQHKVNTQTDDYDEHIFRAVLAFAIP